MRTLLLAVALALVAIPAFGGDDIAEADIYAPIEDRRRVAFDGEDLSEALRARIEAELRAIGFAVADPSEQTALALDVAPTDTGFDIELRDRFMDETVVRERFERGDQGAAIEVVELIRASLLEVRARERVQAKVVPEPKAPPAPKKPAAQVQLDPELRRGGGRIRLGPSRGGRSTSR